MKEETFNELLESVKEAVAISKGEAQPSRVWHIAQVEPAAIKQTVLTPNPVIMNVLQR